MSSKIGKLANVAIGAALIMMLSACQPKVTAGDVSRVTGGTCASTGFTLTNRLNDETREIFSCAIPGEGLRCVSMAGGIAEDETDTVSLLFEDTYGDKPACYKKPRSFEEEFGKAYGEMMEGMLEGLQESIK